MAKGDKNVKTQVLDSATAVRVPFLRGILTRSLQAAGLNFNQAYKLATQVRRELERTPEISSTALRDLLAERLAERHGDEYRQRYLQRQEATPSILVRYPGGNSLPFTPGAMSRSLESAALPVEQASAVAQRLLRRLQHDGCSEIDSQQLARLVHQDLQLHYGVEAAGRYLVWLEYRRSDRPLILLIGGINGVGKSTLAADLAHRLEIVRTQSTDMLREVMRKMTSKRLLPAIHTSSFRAWHALPTGYAGPGGGETQVIDGFLTQAEQVGVAMDAVLKRALSERVAVILEGIHLHPAYMQSALPAGDAIVVPFMLAVLDPEQLRQRLRGRASTAPNRRAERYLKSFDVIWQLQSYLLAEADRCHVPIISDWSSVRAVEQAMDMISAVLARRFAGDPKQVLAS